jgi:hypothetical protein
MQQRLVQFLNTSTLHRRQGSADSVASASSSEASEDIGRVRRTISAKHGDEGEDFYLMPAELKAKAQTQGL